MMPPIPVPAERADDADFAVAVSLVSALRQAPIELGEAVAIVGAGPLARLTAELARIGGAATVRVVAPSQLGDESPSSADVLIYVAGDWQALGEALHLVRDRGRALLLNASGPPVDFNVYPDLHRRSLQLIGVEMPPGTAAAPGAQLVRHLIQAGKLKVGG